MIENDESVKTIEERKVGCLVEMFYKTIRTAERLGLSINGEEMTHEKLTNKMYENMVHCQLNQSGFNKDFYQGYVIGRFDPETAAELSVNDADEFLDISEEAINIIGGNLA